MKQNSRGIVHLLVLLILTIIIFAGISYWAYKNGINLLRQDSGGQEKLTPTPTPAETISQAKNNDLANWKTYIDEKYYFSFEYPDTWDLFGGNKDYKPPSNIYYLTVTTAGSDYNQNDNQDSLVRHGVSLSISIPAVTELSLLEWFDKEKKSELEMLKEQQGENFDVDYEAKLRQMKVIKVNSYFLIPQHVIYIKNKNFIYGLHYNFGSADESELKPIINQILSTFKFIDK